MAEEKFLLYIAGSVSVHLSCRLPAVKFVFGEGITVECVHFRRPVHQESKTEARLRVKMETLPYRQHIFPENRNGEIVQHHREVFVLEIVFTGYHRVVSGKDPVFTGEYDRVRAERAFHEVRMVR